MYKYYILDDKKKITFQNVFVRIIFPVQRLQ